MPSVFVDGDMQGIKEHLIDELDYILVPTEGWNKLVSWYGLTDGQEPIARKVIAQNNERVLSLILVLNCVCLMNHTQNMNVKIL